MGYMQLTAFGETIHFQLYALTVLLFEGFIPTLLLIILNTVSLIKFRLVVSKVAQTNFMRSVEINLVRLVLFLTFICIFTRMLDISTEFFTRIVISCKIQLSSEVDSLRVLLKQLAFFCLFLAHALDGIFYYLYDRHLKQVACHMIKKTCRKIVEFFQGLLYTYN